jgi:hypothetical protein
MSDMKNKMSYSSFWLDSSIFEEDDDNLNKVEKKSADLMKLMAYKRSIGNFVSIVTGKSIPVTFDGRGEDSYTDGKQVVISAKLDDKEFDPVVGLALHEGSHIALTDFTTLTQMRDEFYLPSSIDVEYLIKKYNIVQSEYWTPKQLVARFVGDNLKSLLNYVEDRRIDNHIYTTAPGYRGYYEAMYEKYFHSKIVDKGLQSAEYRDENWDSYMFRIINLTNPNRDLNALKGLREIWNVLDLRNISRLKTSWEALEVAGQILMIIEKNLETSEEKNEGQNGEGQDQGGESNGNSPMSGDMDQQPTNSETSMDAKGGGDSVSSNNNSEGDDSDGDSDSDSGSPMSANQNGAGGQYEPLNDRQRRQLEKAIEDQKKFQEGEIKKTKLSKADKDKVETLDKADIQTEVTGKGLQQGYYGSQTSNGVQTYIINNLNQRLVESRIVGMLTNSSWSIDKGEQNVKKGIQLGTLLGKKLKTRNEERSMTTPRLKSGKLSGRMIHEIGFGNFDIFEQTLVSKSTPVMLHISIDASSSMSGNKWNNTQVAAIAIAKAASMTDNIQVVISYRGVYYANGKCQPLMLIAYDSRKDKFSKIQQLFKHITYDGTTPEGLCYEAILKELTKTKNGTDTYLVNFSDGYPGFDNAEITYGGEYAINHTADQVKKIRQAGVKVLSYFISDGYHYGTESFRKMYGKDSEFINVENVAELAKSLNKKFEVKI